MIYTKDIKKLDTVEIENKIQELKDSLLKAKINKLNQGDFDTNSYKKDKKRYSKMYDRSKFKRKGINYV